MGRRNWSTGSPNPLQEAKLHHETLELIQRRIILRTSVRQKSPQEVTVEHRAFVQAACSQLALDVTAYSAAISACAAAVQWKWAVRLSSEMAAAGHMPPTRPPDTCAFNAVASSCEAAGHWQGALQAVVAMQIGNQRPNVLTFGVALRACVQGVLWEQALHFLAGARQGAIDLDSIAFATAATACQTGGNLGKVPELLKALADSGSMSLARR
eukprot:s6465_g1.t1